MKKLIFTALIAFVLNLTWVHAAPDLVGNWSFVNFTAAQATGLTLAVQKSGPSYSCFIDDYDLDFVDLFASHVSFKAASLQFHIDWALGFSFDGFLSLDGNSLNCVLSNAFGMFPLVIPRQPSVADFIASVYTNSAGSLPYRLFVPPNYRSTNKYPLVMFLHGAGERGTDNVAQVTANIGFLSFISKSNQVQHPCLLVAPQCPTNSDGFWADPIRRSQLLGLVTTLESQYSIDTNRLYITGLSMGGIGTWDQIAQNSSMYAAAVPMSAGGDPSLATSFKNVPVWNFHSVNDSVVDVSFSRLMINALRMAGGNPIYTEYALGDHAIWPIAYYTPGLVDWVMAQRRGQPLSGSIQTTITSPSTNATYATGATNVTLGGTAGDATAAVFGINAFNVQTTAFTPVSGTTHWTASNVPLQAGTTNLVVITAFGTSWSPVLRGNTSFNTSLAVAQVLSPISLSIARSGSNAAVRWSGGAPPFLVLQNTNLTSGLWLDIQTTNGTNIFLPTGARAAFYRVQGQ